MDPTSLSTRARFRVLAPGRTVETEADAYRRAGLAFTWCVRAAWGKYELAHWLVNSYANAIAMTRDPAPARRPDPKTAAAPLPATDVQALLARSHAEVIAIVRACKSWKSDATFARRMIDDGFVVGVMDENDAIGYAPVASATMRLVDRVTSLFLADFLTRPTDYAKLEVCGACSLVFFDGVAAHVGPCTHVGGAWAGNPSHTTPATTARA